MRTASHTDDDIRCIQSRTITPGDENYPSDALHIFAENAPVDEYNIDRLEQIQSPQYALEALDQFLPHVRKQDIDRVLSKGRSETGGLDTKILIKENARVMLTTNVDISDRLINGQLGTVIKVSVDNVSNKPSTIFVKFDRTVMLEYLLYEIRPVVLQEKTILFLSNLYWRELKSGQENHHLLKCKDYNFL